MITNFLIFFKKSPLLALLNSKRLEISPKNGWRALAEGEPTKTFPNWRASWDNFRMTNWVDILDYPELTLQQTQEILAIAI